MRRVVITGMAPFCAAGKDREDFFQNLCEVKNYIQPIKKETEASKALRNKFAVPCPEIDKNEYKDKLNAVRARGSKAAYIACYAALKALDDAGIETPDENTPIFIGTGSGCIMEISESCRSLEKTQRMKVLAVPLCMSNSIGGWMSIILGTHGRIVTMSSACSSSTDSIGTAYENVLHGVSDMAICGGCDYFVDDIRYVPKAFEYLKATNVDPEGKSWSFSKERSGFLFNEGASAMLIIEELEHAKKRNAEIYAEITGFQCNSDGFNIVAMREDGKYIHQLLDKLIENKKVDYYNAHGTGTVLNDDVESMVIKEIFGDKENQPAISATKGILGHSLGASGALEAIVCVESILHNKVHGNVCKTVIDNLNITAETREIPVNRTVTASFGFGGHNAALMIERYSE